ncbi:heat stress transcription factor C-1a-like [Lolium rigidum]|uniref:heat stress transcription factor C-1a-like n=1 Tax=Lolium rigidum TaxID=89674 RepID=UPI001F5DD442|nr:heat stress transcription factor C-1a-like [Lolium rigidum]
MDGLHTELALGLIGCGHGELQTAPFVAKTYQMVCDPRTDAFVRWGRGNNSFLVTDVAGFSQLLLPCFFKHGNFSSFVRQLNTYGFRKVHPDRWEFAHESFLRGQTRLLPRIVRRKKRGEGGAASCSSTVDKQDMAEEIDEDEEGSEALLEEVQQLRQEQTAIGEQLARMSRRLQATERRPDRLMAFLARLAEDPDATSAHLLEQKKRQRMHFPASPIALPLQPPQPPPPLLAMTEDAVDDGVWQWAPEPRLTTFEQPTGSSTLQQVPEFDRGGGGMGITDGGTAVETPFPFCLLGECFF